MYFFIIANSIYAIFNCVKKICNHETNILRRSKNESIVKITNYKKYIYFY